MYIELNDMRLAIVTSQHRSLRQAAEALNIRQSTLSRRLQEIERQLEVVLFKRTNGGTNLTAVGLEFVAGAKRILDEVDTELQRVKSRSRGELGRLTIGVHASPSAGHMHTMLVEYHRRYPNMDVRTIDGSRDRLLSALAGNAVDIAIMTGHATTWDGRMLPLWSERVIVSLPQGHSLGQNSKVRWADLANERFLIPQQGPGPELEGLLSAKLRHVVRSEQIIHQDASLDRLLSLVSANFGALLMFEGATGIRHNGVVYRDVWDDDGPSQAKFIAYWQDSNSNPALGSVLGLLREHHPDFSAQPPRI